MRHRSAWLAWLLVLTLSAAAWGQSGEPSVTLVGIGKPNRPLLNQIQTQVTKVAGIQATIGSFVPLPKSALDKDRDQYNGSALTAVLGQKTAYQGKYVVAITDVDLYLTSKPEWRYCFSAYGGSQGNYAVFSSFRMSPENYGAPKNPGLASERMQKMVLSYIGRYVLKKPAGKDPTSLLFQPILGPDDLDRMELRY